MAAHPAASEGNNEKNHRGRQVQAWVLLVHDKVVHQSFFQIRSCIKRVQLHDGCSDLKLPNA